MTRAQKRALILLETTSTPGVLTVSATAMIDGQPWIHWRTAYSLQRRGFARILGVGEEAEVFLA